MERSGLCECGCGGRTMMATKTSAARGDVKGEPLRFIAGHSAIGKKRGPKPHGIVKCVRCKQMKQYRAKGMCDACWQKDRIEKRKASGEYQIEAGPTKECYNCHVVKPISEFKKNKQMRDGLQAWCNTCRHAKEKEYRTNPEWAKRKAAQEARWWLKQSVERKREIHDRNYKRQKERQETEQEYKARKNFQFNRKNVKRKRLRIASDGNFTHKEWIALCNKYGNICLRCKEKKTLTADHVLPLAMGGADTIDNIQPLCQSCNSRKNDKHIDYRPV